MDTEEAAAYWEANADTWSRLVRAGYDIYRDALNTPAFLAMLPPVAGLKGLDIGCGEGANTRRLAALGARMQAIDIAPTFLQYARAAEIENPLGIDYQVGSGTQLPFADSSFDFATAFMSLMDMPDHAQALREAYRVLRPGGFFQFSILHPCFCPPYRKVLRNDAGIPRAIEISNYFDETDGQVETWWFSTLPPEEQQAVAPFRVPRFHRTLSAWLNLIAGAGLVIQQCGEPSASEKLARQEPVVADTRIAGLFLHLRALRPKTLVL